MGGLSAIGPRLDFQGTPKPRRRPSPLPLDPQPKARQTRTSFGNLVRSPNARSYRLSVHGVIAPDRRDHYDDCDGYWRSVTAVADSPDQAFELFLEIREPEEGVSLALGEVTAGDADENPHGVYWVSGRVFYKKTD